MKMIKKYYPLIVGLVLLLSVAAYGTRAYFSDSAEEQAGINLTLGTVDVSTDSGKWVYNSESMNGNMSVKGGNKKEDDATVAVASSKDQNLSKYATITDARPGDQFSKEFTFTNAGTLDQKLTFTPNGNKTNGIFIVTWEKSVTDVNESKTPIGENDVIELNPNETFKAKMNITVNLTSNPQKFDDKTLKNIDFDKFVGETVKVDVEQTNAPTKTPVAE